MLLWNLWTITSSKRKPKLIESDDGREFANKIFESDLNSQKRRYSRFTSRAVITERFNRTIRNLSKKQLFENGNAIWIDLTKSISNNTTSQFTVQPR